jgi:cytoskeletal protein RodZ
MKLFGRNKNNVDQVPSEVQDYYKSERRERVGLAWLLALGTLVVTLIIAAGLFFGGRWAYRKITGNENKTPQTAQQQNQNQEGGQTSSTNTDQGNNNQGNNQDEGGNHSGSTPPPASTPTPTPTPPAPTPTPTPPAQENNSVATATPQSAPAPDTSLANTGPGDVIAAFVLTAVAGTIAHHVVWVRNRQ